MTRSGPSPHNTPRTPIETDGSTRTAAFPISIPFHPQFCSVAFVILLVVAHVVYAGEQGDKGSGRALELATIEIMVEQLEEMPRSTEDERNQWASLSMEIQERIDKIVSYETRSNLEMWVLIGRWAGAGGIERDKSPYADEPFFHIRRLRPDYQQDAGLLKLMAKLNAIRVAEHEDLTASNFKSFVYLFEQCDTNDPGIQLQIGQAYDEGNGLWRNEHEAVKWYRRAADAGNADALGELGEAYLYGQGPLENDDAKGEQLLLEAVNKGSASAAFTLGHHYRPHEFWDQEGNPEKCLEMFRIAAEGGYYKAFSQAAREYVRIGNGRKALHWANGGDEPDATDKKARFQWEMRRGLADSQGWCSYIKGEVYALGIGDVEQDLPSAKSLFEIAFEKGATPAAWALAAMYHEGIGVERDVRIAQHWESKARQSGFGSIETHRRQANEFAKRLRDSEP